jgi:ribonuclease G
VDKELIINSSSAEIDIALLEDKFLVELHKEKNNNNYSVGDVYLGRVKKIIPGLNAAFVNIGYEKDAFLHYFDLGPQIKSLYKFINIIQSSGSGQFSLEKFKLESNIEKTGKISQVLERNRLKRLIQSIKPNNFGVIIRTVAENIRVADLDTDMKDLLEKWSNLTKKLASAKAPQKVFSELDLTTALLRDLLNESFNNIYVDNPVLYEDIKSYIGTFAPQKIGIVKLYKGKKPIFEFFGIDKQIKSSFGKTVTIKSGIYLVIEHTEALHVIDVNSGHKINKENSQETNALEVNLEAATEIARQLRLRDMGGIIVVDFIDMHEAKNRKSLYQKIKDEMAKDHAKHTVLPPSKFGLIQITRQRVRPEMNIEILEKCPVCDGSGKIKPSIIFTDEIEKNIKYLLHDQNEPQLTLSLHPYLYAYLTKGLFSIQTKWFYKFKKWIKIRSMPSYHVLEYHFYDKNNDEIKM